MLEKYKKDRKTIYTMMAQVFSMLGPFLFLSISTKFFSKSEVVLSELFLSVITFSVIIIDWSTALLLSNYVNSICSSGKITTIFLFRFFISSLVLISIGLILYINSRIDSTLFFSFCLVFFSSILDFSWYFLGKKMIWFPPLSSSIKYFFSIGFLFFGISPILSLSFSYLIFSLLIFFYLLPEINFGNCSALFFKYLFNRFAFPTVSETLTAVFSKLDIVFASIYLEINTLFSYVIIRKLVLALSSVLFSAVKNLYLEDNVEISERYKSQLKISSFLLLLVGSPTIVILGYYFFNLKFTYTNIIAALLFLLIFPLGYYKNVIQFEVLLRVKKFKSDFVFTLMSLLFFLSAALIFKPSTLNSFVILRLIPDIVYVLFFYINNKKRIFLLN